VHGIANFFPKELGDDKEAIEAKESPKDGFALLKISMAPLED